MSIRFVFYFLGFAIYTFWMDGWKNAVKDKMEKSHLSVALVADKLGMTEGGLRHWLNGTRKPSIDQFLELCAAVELDPCAALCQQLQRVTRTKEESPVIKQILNADPTKSAAYKPLTDKLRAFKSAARRAKSHR